jgi:hypothetical protein
MGIKYPVGAGIVCFTTIQQRDRLGDDCAAHRLRSGITVPQPHRDQFQRSNSDRSAWTGNQRH